MLGNKGKKVDDIPVKISYRIIELFSAGLYSSPNKAFEELVSNSYDANADKVAVFIPTGIREDDAIIWVCDNGDSMGKEGLKDLWKIGESTKTAIRNKVVNGRLPIGKFGIGKLATYILTNILTYICKTNEGYFAVSMNFSSIDKKTEHLKLDEIELSEDEVKDLLDRYLVVGGEEMIPFSLFGDDAEPNWTFTLLSNLKPKATEIKEGRLKWILATALPLNPGFELFYNGLRIESSKVKTSPWKTWIFGADDKIIEKNENFEAGLFNNEPCVNLPSLKNVSGEIVLYKDSLLTGAKSERIGRSHGIFVMVRKRLINIDDPLFGMDALSHGVFNRCRIIVNADDLDNFITSTREAVKEVAAREELVLYIKRKFQEVKDWYFEQVEAEEEKNRASYKIAHTAASYSRRPLIIATKKFFDNEISGLWLTDIPIFSDESKREDFVKELEANLTSEVGIIRDVVWETIGPDQPMAKLDLLSGVAKINSLHPFFANFIEEVRSFLPFKLIALTEILTEVSLVEQGVDESQVREIMHRRDRILRELTYSDKPNAPLVASLLHISVNDSTGLEDSLVKAFAAIGFESNPIGGNGKPDGIAVAYLEHKNSDKNYKVTFDAKSTKKEKIMASTARISGIDRHRRDYSAQYAVVVAVDFEGATKVDSAVNKEAKNLEVNLIRAKDFGKLILLAGPKQLGLEKLREFFENCHTVVETSQWIDEIQNLPTDPGPFKEILEVTRDLMKEDLAIPNITSIRLMLGNKDSKYKSMTPERLRSLLVSLQAIVPGYVTLSGNDFSLQSTPEIILKELNSASSDATLPIEFREMYLQSYGQG